MNDFMKKDKMLFLSIAIIIAAVADSRGNLFDLSIEEINDSASLLQKGQTPGDPLYPYFSTNQAPKTRSDIAAIINKKVLPNPSFAFEATQLAELETTDKYENLSNDIKDVLSGKNRNLLSELYPDEILPRNPESIKQEIKINIPIRKADSTNWLKAEISNFMNEIVGNELVLSNWENIKPFFSDNVSDNDIMNFSEEMLTYIKQKIPINGLAIIADKKQQTAEVYIRGKKEKTNKKLFVVSVIPGESWKIQQVSNIKDDLLQAGYIVKKEVNK
jgi:hypothetical protein